MEKQTKPKPLGLSMAKKILAVIIIFIVFTVVFGLVFGCRTILVEFEKDASRQEMIKSLGIFKVFTKDRDVEKLGKIYSGFALKFNSIEERDKNLANVYSELENARNTGLIDNFKWGERKFDYGLTIDDKGEIFIIPSGSGVEKEKMFVFLNSMGMLEYLDEDNPRSPLSYSHSLSLDTPLYLFTPVYFIFKLKSIVDKSIEKTMIYCWLE